MMNTSGVNHETLVITSATELTQDQIDRIAEKFKGKSGVELKKVEPHVDPSLISGIRLQSESFYYEDSGYKTLNDLKRNLTNDSLKGAE